ncbi:MAG: translation elongation factor Ts, partial [Rhizobiaceae bacterium]
MTVTAAMVKELRDKTGAGMMDCKNALNENDGDIEAAVDWLRAKGISKAEKKSGRVATEGLVGIASDNGRAAVVEVNSETDFVARNEQFQDIVGRIAKTSLGTDGSVETVGSTTVEGGSKSVADTLTDAVATIGENIGLRRAAVMSVDNGVVATYMHNSVSDGLGKIGVLVALESDGDKAALNAIGRQIAMHVAATNPLAATRED